MDKNRTEGTKHEVKGAIKETVGKVTRSQIREIAQIKMPDLNAVDLDAASKVVEGTARSMGIEVTG